MQSTSLANQAEKRQRSFDKVVEEWKRKVADLQGELERSQRESRGHAAEVYKLRAQLDETHETVEAVRRENKNLTGRYTNSLLRSAVRITPLAFPYAGAHTRNLLPENLRKSTQCSSSNAL